MKQFLGIFSAENRVEPVQLQVINVLIEQAQLNADIFFGHSFYPPGFLRQSGLSRRNLK